MKIGVLISGRGSNMFAIAKAVSQGEIPDSEVAVVISDQAKAGGLEIAKGLGIKTKVIERQGRTRRSHDAEIASVLIDNGVDLVCLAGYMRLLSKEFVKAFPDRILNIHPSLLPAFKGLNAQRQAVDYGVKITGCTLHLVDESLDHGAIILQKSIEVSDSDSEDSLSERLIEIEHAAYVEGLKIIVSGKYEKEGRKIVIRRTV